MHFTSDLIFYFSLAKEKLRLNIIKKTETRKDIQIIIKNKNEKLKK